MISNDANNDASNIMLLSPFEEDEKLMMRKEPAVLPPMINQLFFKKSYANAFDKADSEKMNVYSPLLKVKRSPMDNEPESITKTSTERMKRVASKFDEIKEMEREARNIRVENYGDLFDNDAGEDIVTLAEIEVNELEEESKKAVELKKQQKLEDENAQKRQFRELKEVSRNSKDELIHKGELMKNQIIRMEELSIKEAKERDVKIRRSFFDSGKLLKKYMRHIKHTVKSTFKDLYVYDEKKSSYLTEMSERFMPQSITFHLELIRCVKDKIPNGRYAFFFDA